MKNFTGKPRRSLLALAILSATGSVLADETMHQVSIGPQNISDALKVLATEMHIQIFSDGDALKGKKTNGIQGNFTAKEAVQKLLQGTGLSYTFTADDAVAVKAAQPGNDTTLPAVKVTDNALSPTDPYNPDYNRLSSSTATKTDTPIMETPYAVTVVPQQVLKDKQVIRVEDAVTSVAGVQSSWTNGGQSDVFMMRGFQNTNLYRDGFLLPSALGGGTAKRQVANLEQIEVLKGAGSLLYGRSEPGGVINLVTKRPQATA